MWLCAARARPYILVYQKYGTYVSLSVVAASGVIMLTEELFSFLNYREPIINYGNWQTIDNNHLDHQRRPFLHVGSLNAINGNEIGIRMGKPGL